jgi:hypothetical protein
VVSQDLVDTVYEQIPVAIFGVIDILTFSHLAGHSKGSPSFRREVPPVKASWHILKTNASHLLIGRLENSLTSGVKYAASDSESIPANRHPIITGRLLNSDSLTHCNWIPSLRLAIRIPSSDTVSCPNLGIMISRTFEAQIASGYFISRVLQPQLSHAVKSSLFPRFQRLNWRHYKPLHMYVSPSPHGLLTTIRVAGRLTCIDPPTCPNTCHSFVHLK